MEYIVEKHKVPAPNNQLYTLFGTKEVTDIDGVARVIPDKIGDFSIEQLEQQIAGYEKAADECRKKLAAIRLLQEKELTETEKK